MKKSLLLFLFLIFAIVFWKVTESKMNDSWNEAASDEFIPTPELNEIAEN